MFAETDGAVIKNVNINSHVYNEKSAGIVQVANNTSIDNCDVYISLNYGICGGIAAEAYNSTITNCCVTATGYIYEFGGIVYSTSGNTVIANCVLKNSGVNVTSLYGGIVGEACGKTEIYNCANSDIFNSRRSGGIVSYAEMSGLTLENNMYYEENGAYTGEQSADMLTDAGVSYVILGHSERRQYFNEDDRIINKKIKKALEHDIIPIICCGETIEQREAGITLEFVRIQIVNAFAQVSKEDAKRCIVAYEPIWAIGTGHVATTGQAQEVCAAIRKDISDIYDEETAQAVRILYGGSVNMSNAAEIFAQPDIDGGLVGGASTKPEFANIVNYQVS